MPRTLANYLAATPAASSVADADELSLLQGGAVKRLTKALLLSGLATTAALATTNTTVATKAERTYRGVIASEAAMLALGAAKRGDWIKRDDSGTAWELIAEPAATLANWLEYPGAAGGGGGITDHALLTNRDAADQHSQSSITGLGTALGARELAANKGTANGYAPLDGAQRVPTANLPTTAGITEGANLYFTDARVRAVALTGLSLTDTSAVVAADTILQAMGKLAAGKRDSIQGVNAQAGANYTLAASDRDRRVSMTSASANTITIPENASVAIPVGFVVWYQQDGSGKTTITPAGAVGINAPGTTPLASPGQRALYRLEKTATDVWALNLIGQAGTAAAGGWRFSLSASTTDSDPGAGSLRLNSASNPTQFYIDDIDIDANDLQALYRLLGEGMLLRLTQSSDESRWMLLQLQGTIEATGYWKIACALVNAGLALQAGQEIRLTLAGVALPYQGQLSGDVSALSRNADGSVATITIAGCAWTQNYNANGTLNTETFAGLTRTYSYDASGRPSGATGAIEVAGSIRVAVALATSLKSALVTAGAAASGSRWTFTDLGVGYQTLEWATDHFRPFGREEAALLDNDSAIANPNNGSSTAESSALRSVNVPGWLASEHSWVRTEAACEWNANAVGSSKTLRTYYGTAVIGQDTSGANTQRSARVTSGKVKNKEATNVQFGKNITSGSSGYGNAISLLFAGTQNSTTDLTLSVTIQNGDAADVGTLQSFAAFWGAS